MARPLGIDTAAGLVRLGSRPSGLLATPPAGRLVRLSLAWLADPVLDPIPLFTPDRATVVVRWPTDGAGRVVSDDLHAAHVMRWVVSGDLLDQLRDVHAEWPLAAHDLLFGGQPVAVRPCARSLLQAVAVRLPVLARRLEAERDAQIAALTGELARQVTVA